MKLTKIKKNPNNPRVIRDEKFELLKKSIQDFPAMMELRPIVVDDSWTILGGNMRFEAIKALGMKEIPEAWVKRASDLTDEQKRQFIIKDNVAFGTWDFDLLANEFDAELLREWGVDVPAPPSVEDLDLDEFFTPSETVADNNDKIVLEYTRDEADRVRAALSEIDSSCAKAVWKLLNL